MSKNIFPNIMPQIKIKKINMPCFKVRCEEDFGDFIIPKIGKTVSFAAYDYPKKQKTSQTNVEVLGKARLHGIDCVEIKSIETGKSEKTEYIFYERLTDTHIQSLGESYYENGTKVVSTFYDEDFLKNYQMGEDNCGVDIELKKKNIISDDDAGNLKSEKSDIIDVVGRYSVSLGEKEYDTIKCVFFDSSDVMVERYIDKSGRTVLWRRYNKNDWMMGKNGNGKALWTEQLPENETCLVNGDIYVHWYDCISEYAL